MIWHIKFIVFDALLEVVDETITAYVRHFDDSILCRWDSIIPGTGKPTTCWQLSPL